MIFFFFGFNELFVGEEGVDGFCIDILWFVDEILEKDYLGGGVLRIVFVLLIVFEDIGDVNFFSGEEYNCCLFFYIEVLKLIVEEKLIVFVDFFMLMWNLFVEMDVWFMINGVYFNDDGYRVFVLIFMEVIFGLVDVVEIDN